MKIVIKKATVGDLKKIQELNLQLFKKENQEYDPLLSLSWTFGKDGTKYFRDRILMEDGCVLIAVIDNKIVGYLCGGIAKAEKYRNLPIVAELENTFVIEEYRSKGIGKKLLKEFIKWCRSKKVGKIKVEVFAQNGRAIKFYRSNNFRDYTLVLERF